MKKAAQVIYRASTETRHFDWEAFGGTEAEAKKLLAKALRKNTEFSAAEVKRYVEDANITEIRLGTCLRDGSAVAA